MIVCALLVIFFFFVSLNITYHFKHSQFYIKFDETYLLALTLACFFFSLVGFKSFILVVICIRVLLFFSLLVVSFTFCRCVSLARSLSLVVVIVVVVFFCFISPALR